VAAHRPRRRVLLRPPVRLRTRRGERAAGTLLGFVGNTGDAEPTPPHLHFEIHPGGEPRPAIDPHRVLLAWQEHGIVASGGWLARYGRDTAPPPGALVEVRDFIAGE
jgi:hypothetical protein